VGYGVVSVFFSLRPTAPRTGPDESPFAAENILVKTATTILSFDAGLFLFPRKISGPDPGMDVTPILVKLRHGEMKIRCSLKLEGVLRDCRVLKGIPELDRPVVSALEKRRYSPAQWNDRPIEIDYTVKFSFNY